MAQTKLVSFLSFEIQVLCDSLMVIFQSASFLGVSSVWKTRLLRSRGKLHVLLVTYADMSYLARTCP